MGAEQNHLCPVIEPAAGPPPPSARRASCWRARRSRPASRSWPCPRRARRLVRRGRVRGSYVGRLQIAAPIPRRCSGSARSAGTDRVRHRDRAAVAGLDLDRARRTSAARATCAPGLGVAPRQPRAARARTASRMQLVPRRDGTRPRRCGGRSGRGCAAPAGRGVGVSAPGHRLAAGDPPELADPLARPAGALALERLDEHTIWLEQVVAFERRRLVQHLVGRRHGAQTTRARGAENGASQRTRGSREFPGAPR